MGALKRAGFKTIKTFPEDEPIVSMIEFEGEIFVATSKSVYRRRAGSDEFDQMQFVQKEDEPCQVLTQMSDAEIVRVDGTIEIEVEE